MKYSDLQKLAKSHGIKANMKAAKLIEALLEVMTAPDSIPGKGSPAVARPELLRPEEGIPFASPAPVKAKKRSRNSSSNEPELDKREEAPHKRVKRNTGSPHAPSQKKSASPGTLKLIDSLDGELDANQQKETLLVLLDEKVKGKQKKLATTDQPTHIPRFTAMSGITKKIDPNEGEKKTPAKDWSKIHQKEIWSKMDSLDVYVKKRNARNEARVTPGGKKASLGESVKKIKAMTEEMRSAVASLKKTEEKKTGPHIVKPMRPAKAVSPRTKPPGGAFFVPNVMSTSKMNLNFGGVAAFNGGSKRCSPRLAAGHQTPQNAKAKPAVKTGTVTKSPRTVSMATKPVAHVVPSSASKENKAKSVNSCRKSAFTPFKFVGDTTAVDSSELASAKKFDLQASLARPLTWKPHIGKLKPFSVGSAVSHQTDVKGVKVVSRDDRRKRNQEMRANARLDAKMKKRGVLA